MTNRNVLDDKQYARLSKDIRALIEEGRALAADAVNRHLIRTYWEIGRRISREALTENAGYAQAVFDDLSDELDIDSTTLKRCVYFFHTYKSAPGGTHLTWSHYKYLLSLADDRQRRWYEDLAQNNRLTRAQLSRAIKEDRYSASLKTGSKAPLPAAIKRPVEAAYLYKALVDRVIDGDTLLLDMDLGFGVWKKQRLRLAQVDAPAMDEPGGPEACRYVRDRLAGAQAIVVKTHKIDIYGRYVGHVFYEAKDGDKGAVFAQGRHLNAELVDLGLAKVM